MIKRILNPSLNRSFFLFGPRQVGKSTYVQSLLKKQDLYINLLPQRIFLDYLRNPGLFRQEILAHKQQYEKFTCIVDEIQKIPALLDEVHDLIENHGIRFILTGSSARKLKRGAANLLAGRASTYYLYPCTYSELKEQFDLERILLEGSLPYLWSNATNNIITINQEDKKEFLQSYTEVYLREEIQAEGIVRNIAPFARFIDIAANNDGEIVNYSNIARECGISLKTIKEYYQILEDTFIAYRIDPWIKSIRKRLISHPKYYLFDLGITNTLCHQYLALNPEVRGRRFEQFIILQFIAINHYFRFGFEYFFWRTSSGLEIDLILTLAKNPVAAIEIKSTTTVVNSDSYALSEFKKEYPTVTTYIVAPVSRTRLLSSGVQVIPWQDFLEHELKKLSLQ